MVTCLFLMACQGHMQNSAQSPSQNEQSLNKQTHMPIAKDKTAQNEEHMRGPLNP